MAHNNQREEQPVATASGKYIIQSALRTLRALDLFTTYNTNIGVAEMQKELNINSNMAFRILHTLEAAKYVVQDLFPNTQEMEDFVFRLLMGGVDGLMKAT